MSEPTTETGQDFGVLTDDELRALAAELDLDLGDAEPLDREAAEAQIREAAALKLEAAPPEPPPTASKAEKKSAKGAKSNGSTGDGKKTVTYLGRPETIAHDENGDPVGEDVYLGIDRWDDGREIKVGVGESELVSAEKAAQLEQDHPGAFEIS